MVRPVSQIVIISEISDFSTKSPLGTCRVGFSYSYSYLTIPALYTYFYGQ